MLLILLLAGAIGRTGCSGNRFEVERYDTGDAFESSGNKNCSHFKGYYRGTSTIDCNTTLECCCEFGQTFDTLSSKCYVPGKRFHSMKSGTIIVSYASSFAEL